MMEVLAQLSDRDLEILNIIQKKGPITKKDLQVIADIKLTMLNRIMRTLENTKIISEHGESESTGGRKAIEYDVSQTELLYNKDAVEVINKGAKILGIGLANLVRLLNPELVILSGPLIMNFENYYEKCIETLHNIRSDCYEPSGI